MIRISPSLSDVLIIGRSDFNTTFPISTTRSTALVNHLSLILFFSTMQTHKALVSATDHENVPGNRLYPHALNRPKFPCQLTNWLMPTLPAKTASKQILKLPGLNF